MKQQPTKNLGHPKSAKSKKPKVGDFFEVRLGPELFAYGRVLPNSTGFYNAFTKSPSDFESIKDHPFAFRIWVMDSAFKSQNWSLIGNYPLSEQEAKNRVWFFKEDSLSGDFSTCSSWNGEWNEIRTTISKCVGLERATVWFGDHVEDRLRDLHKGIQCKWVRNLAIDRA